MIRINARKSAIAVEEAYCVMNVWKSAPQSVEPLAFMPKVQGPVTLLFPRLHLLGNNNIY